SYEPTTVVHLLTAPPNMPWVTMGPEGWRPVTAWGGNAGSPQVVPGTYQVELSVDGKPAGTQPLTVLKDPASPGTPASMAEQLQFSLQMRNEVNQVAAMINGVESTRKQLEDAVLVLGNRPGSSAAIASDKALEAKYVASSSSSPTPTSPAPASRSRSSTLCSSTPSCVRSPPTSTAPAATAAAPTWAPPNKRSRSTNSSS